MSFVCRQLSREAPILYHVFVLLHCYRVRKKKKSSALNAFIPHHLHLHGRRSCETSGLGTPEAAEGGGGGASSNFFLIFAQQATNPLTKKHYLTLCISLDETLLLNSSQFISPRSQQCKQQQQQQPFISFLLPFAFLFSAFILC